MKASKYYRILSPDGFDIRHDKYKYEESEIQAEIEAFTKRYEPQGFYSSPNWKIPLDKIAECCSVIPC